MEFFATCPRGMESLLAEELRGLGAASAEAARAGGRFSGDLPLAYRACLWSRVANRVLLPLHRFAAADEQSLYDGVRAVAWREHLGPHATLRVDFSSTRSQITHTHYGAQRTKDAIVDQLRDQTGARPTVDLAWPDVRVNVHIEDDRGTVSIDLSGDSLHRRGWRREGTEAPLKENLAAALLLLAGWPERARTGEPLIDPMCGSGTVPIEAALMAGDVAPGLLRGRFGFTHWLGHDPAAFAALCDEARARAKAAPPPPPIFGFDADPHVLRVASDHVERAGLSGRVMLQVRPLEGFEPPLERRGIVVTNPPYGERLGDEAELGPLYQLLGDLLRRRFTGWSAFVLTGNLALAKRIGLRPTRRHVLYNGAIECRLLELAIHETPVQGEGGPAWRKPPRPTPAAEMFRNRLAKNWKHLRKWTRREDVHCYRVYDQDLPEYAVAVDLYEDAVHVAEYECPPTVDARAAERRLHDVMAVAPEVLGVRAEDAFLKVRRRQRGLEQYEKQDARGVEKRVREGGHTLLVNLSDYLDTGLFLDHRRLRAMVGELASGRRFLNLFGYTGTATVYAAKGGARASTTVDMSNTYLDWAGRNFALNGLDERRHEIIRDDVIAWLPRQRARWDLIFLAPPTYSRSKRMTEDFDLQRDHVGLLEQASALLEPGGVLLFSNHYRRFKMDTAALGKLEVVDITAKTIPPDFQRDARIHNCWRITHR